jgi:pSer/pThr/pTyr-binding forkhead associated (FHA) protein
MAMLDEFESRLQSLLEVHLLMYLPGYKVEDGIVQQLAAAMHGHLREDHGVLQAPNLYVVVAHPATLTCWHAEPRLLKELANALYTAGEEAGSRFPTKPVVTTTADINMPANEVRIIASFINESVAETHGPPAETKLEPSAETIPSNAFFIIGGAQIVLLNRFVTNIGRRLDNHIVIDDPRISRAHAQLRIVKDRFILFDLNSTGGTFVNGQRTNQSVLHPGDVISLAGVTLIFGQDPPAKRTPSEEQTEAGSFVSADRPTAVIRKEDEAT